MTSDLDPPPVLDDTTSAGLGNALARLTALAMQIADCPFAVINEVDGDCYAGRGVAGSLPGLGLQVGDRQAPDDTLCHLVLARDEPVTVEDAAADPASSEVAVVAAGGIRGWAGVPLHRPDGTVLAALTVADVRPRRWTDAEIDVLSRIAAIAAGEMILYEDLSCARSTVAASRLDAQESRQRAADASVGEHRARQEAKRSGERAERAETLAAAARQQARSAVEVAETLQRSLTPLHPPRVPGMEIAARHRPAAGGEVLGDFYDVFTTPTGWGIVVGDVCGKGTQAARSTALARSTARALGHTETDPSAVLTALNGVLHEWFGAERTFVTAVYVTLEDDGDDIRVRVASAGHPPGVVRSADGAARELAAGGRALGIVEDGQVAEECFTLEPGASLTLTTDGVHEARRGRGRPQFGEEGLLAALADAPTAGMAETLADAVVDAVVDHAGPTAGDDTVVVVIRNPLRTGTGPAR